MRIVQLESPFAGKSPAESAANVAYAKAAMLDCLRRGEAPFASHLLYTQCLDDAKPDERMLGIGAGLAFLRVADASAVYIDRGLSRGMRLGIEAAEAAGVPVEFRTLEGADVRFTLEDGHYNFIILLWDGTLRSVA